MVITIELAELSMLLAGSSSSARRGAKARRDLNLARQDPTQPGPERGWRCGGPQPFDIQGPPAHSGQTGNTAAADASGDAAGQGSEKPPTPRGRESGPADRR
ncbi:hypothetical protein ACLMAL_37875 [Nocardia sp. CWNU-33]|uniref:hypothetical protein n=1 Tax=Nocardia sp. CWNU-33 TaxID=3392117 RepID=UPI00398EB4F5